MLLTVAAEDADLQAGSSDVKTADEATVAVAATGVCTSRNKQQGLKSTLAICGEGTRRCGCDYHTAGL